jgi:hypothetical protein
VVESGGHRVTLLDGERFEPVHRLAVRGILQGDPQFSPDGRYAFFATQQGWISKYDLRELRGVAEVRAGTESRSLALSSDGRLLAVGNVSPPTLAVFDAELQPVTVLAATDGAGRASSPVTLVRNAPVRRSFIAALPGLKEIWEVSYDPAAPEIAQGLVHDYKLREGTFISGFLNPRRTPLDEAVEDFRLLPDGHRLAGIAHGAGRGQVIHLDVRRRIATIDRDGFEAIGAPNPELSARLRGRSGVALADVSFDRHGRYAFASLNQVKDALIVYDTSTLREVKRLSMPGPVRKYSVFNEIKRHQGNSHQP